MDSRGDHFFYKAWRLPVSIYNRSQLAADFEVCKNSETISLTSNNYLSANTTKTNLLKTAEAQISKTFFYSMF